MPARAALRRDLPLVQRTRNSADRNRALGPERPQQREQAPSMVIGPGYRGCAAYIAGFSDVGGITQLAAARLPDSQGCSSPLRDQPPLFLGQRRVEVQHER